ncbi:glycosyltransferase family 2 protein [Rhizobium paknamense]|uniref:Succinoglycan biosynthesis protein ExoW n=1 Tax=Rhizobium paknamense TaxID=1206817 RepID=A0ABU0IGC5_9HYPH|nr:glycosyltransferase family A protein [Rhizobium paknamense]MDQ0457305.1 succinoglycan biosynthesis protein ExoW [Rhizobium paknamense]
MKVTVAVVIPFYQREAGILARALESVRTQTVADRIYLHVVVVDDSSPMPPAQDLAPYEDVPEMRVTLLQKPNGGPGEARNMALDYLEDHDIDYIAFLDSDDVWHPDHLERALDGLAHGDFFFCNHVRGSHYADYFLGLPETRRLLAAEEEITCGDGFRAFRKGTLSGVMIRECPPQTSTVVYRFKRNIGLRFNGALRSAGEDHVFWIELSLFNDTVVDPRINVSCLEGVNLYWSNVSWSSPKSVAIQGCLALQFNYMKNTPVIMLADPQTILFRHRLYEGAYTYALIRGLVKGFLPEFKVFARLALAYPGYMLRVLGSFRFFIQNRRIMTNETAVKTLTPEDVVA